mmetsp:Transcript_27941/g.27791  ORF Transcript_27941/g.27791 Transcript_27941/m.27791 type:complete len:171 (-) Transcript_27941:55-567(-)
MVFIDALIAASLVKKLYQTLLKIEEGEKLGLKCNKKSKKEKKCKRVRNREESKLEVCTDIESHQVISPVVEEEKQDPNMTINSNDSEDSLVKVAPIEEPIPKPAKQIAPPVPTTRAIPQIPVAPIQQVLPNGYPSTIQIDGKTFMAIKASDFEQLQKKPAQSFYFAPRNY